MKTLGYTPFDCDNHYYEALDAFTRHVPREWQKRCVQWCEIDGRKYHIVGGEVSKAVSNPTWDPIAKPGALRDYFRGNPTGRSPLEMLKDREPLPGEYMDRDLRIEKIKEQGLQGAQGAAAPCRRVARGRRSPSPTPPLTLCGATSARCAPTIPPRRRSTC